jgi:calcineurin-like phosphoesterase family protein
MKRWWTADLHLGHDNILEYCGRPFKDAITALHRTAVNFNQKIRTEDAVVHVGDYMSRGNVKGQSSLPFKFPEYVAMFNGRWTFLRGNHDANNGVKTVGDFMIAKLADWNVFVGHWPLNSEWYAPALVDAVRDTCHLVLCGHVHQHWKWSMALGVPHVNIGIDQWDQFPVEDAELIEFIKANVEV